MRSLIIMLDTAVPRNGGAALRNFQTVQSLAKFGPVDAVAFDGTNRDGDPVTGEKLYRTPQQLRAERRFAERVRGRLWQVRPGAHFRLDSYASVRTLAAVRELVDRTCPDVVVASQWPTAQYALAAAPGRRLIFDTHNVEVVLRQGIADAAPGDSPVSRSARLAAGRLEAWETRLGRAADQVWVCSEDDARLWVDSYGDSTPVRVVPNTVSIPAIDSPHSKARVRGRMVFTGRMSYAPNNRAARELVVEILPLVRRNVPHAAVEIVGLEPTAEVLALHDPRGGVVVTGAVPDVAPHLAAAAVMVVPLREGGGTRLKILEAMAAGLPVVSTPKGAEGLEISDGVQLMLGSSPADLAAASVRLMTDQELSARVSLAGRRLVEDRYSGEALDRCIAASLAEIGLP